MLLIEIENGLSQAKIGLKVKYFTALGLGSGEALVGDIIHAQHRQLLTQSELSSRCIAIQMNTGE